MTNIWEFLLQTMEVSLTAAILLLVKELFRDKLSPRWQYAIWTLLAAKILLPAHLMGRYLSVTLAARLEVVKNAAEEGAFSAYSDQWVPIGQSSSVIPYVTQLPVSVTDWLFLIYIAGVLACLLWYGLSYLRLRRILRQGKAAEDTLQDQIDDLCSRYALEPCRAVLVEGIPSAFICGFFQPVLAIPEAKEEEERIDDKVLLHELLHKTYADALQSMLWCLMRALHWCNPFLLYAFHRIGNDMESLCDQRVLEQLEGEERREYGRILLSMTDEKYARAPGTTSLSNGGKNIMRRIEAITRFKKYPRGMALASVCVLIVLAAPLFAGKEVEGFSTDYPDLTHYRSQIAMTEARMNRCTTPAGAIDTWVKGNVFNLPVYLAAVTPYGEQDDLKQLVNKGTDFSSDIVHRLKGAPFFDYVVYNLQKEGEAGYTALAVLVGEKGYEYLTGCEEGMQPVMAIPLTLQKENGWTVTQSGKIQEYQIPTGLYISWGCKELPGVYASKAKSKNGIVTIREQTVSIVDNHADTEGDFFADMMGDSFTFDRRAKRSAEFHEVRRIILGGYQDCQNRERRQKVKSIGMMAALLEHMDDETDWQFSDQEMEEGDSTGSSSAGQAFESVVVDKAWSGYFDQLMFDVDGYSQDQAIHFEGFAVRIYQNGELTDTLRIKRGARL